MTFLSGDFLHRKFQFHQSALIYVAISTIKVFSIILKTQTSIVFQESPLEKENFLWENLLCFGHHYTLGSLIEAHIRSVTMEILQKFNLPKYVH